MATSTAAALAVNDVRGNLGIPNPEAVPKEDELKEGYMRLYDYWKPSLPAGLYSINASQNIKGQGQEQPLKNQGEDQKFAVVAPQFSLDPKFINSCYPPDGHQAEGHILPHIVFSDPHIPWLRQSGTLKWMTEVADGRNFVPWLALMVFKAGELDVTPSEAAALKLDVIKTKKSTTEVNVYQSDKLPANGAYGLTVGDYLTTISSTVNYNASNISTEDYAALTISNEPTSIIFPTKDLVQGVFNPTKDSQLLGIKRQRLLSHVRQLNTTGFPDASLSGHGYYSVLLSAMTGDMLTIAPTTHVVHLVSIENLDATLSANAGPNRIGLVSLYSWTYTCIPESVNFVEMMTRLGKQMQPLRLPVEAMQAVTGSPNVYARLQNGYTIVRWRAPTGEESVAFNRGPLVPGPTADVPGGKDGKWPGLSMTGRDYTIYDQTMGMIDATYSSAWSLGRLSAISDSVFNAALLRFRSAIWKTSSSKLRMRMNNVETWSDVLSNAIDGINDATAIAAGSFSGPVTRTSKPVMSAVSASLDTSTVQQELANEIQAAIEQSASTSETVVANDPNSAKVLYNGYLPAPAASSDWHVIYDWIYDVMFLGRLPAHVMFPEPSHLKGTIEKPLSSQNSHFEAEALRFFHIDHAWIDCFIDGALSCANHVEPQYDFTRLKIKQIFNQVLAQEIGSPKYGTTGKTPAVPRYGFVLRSAVVKSTPDLKLTVKCWKGVSNGSTVTWKIDDSRQHLVRHTRLDDTTILSLIDCLPEEIASIEMAQPAHQQRYSFASTTTRNDEGVLKSVESKVKIVKLFTNVDRAPPNKEVGGPMDPDKIDLEWKALPIDKQLTDDEQKTFYDPTTRCIDALQMCDMMTEKIVQWGSENGCFDESRGTNAPKGVASASMFGIEMNDRSGHFVIENGHPGELPKTWTRQLWTGASLPAVSPSLPTDGSTSVPRDAVSQPPVPRPGRLPSEFPSVVPHWSGPQAVTLPQSPVPGPPAPPSKRSLQFQPHPFVTIGTPEFELLVHPDWMPPPPRPDTGVAGIGSNLPAVHSVRDFLPTRTMSLYDLIFSIRRRRPNAPGDRVLRTLQIEIPVSLGNRDADARNLDSNGNLPREPLIQAVEGAFGAVSMAANERFVPLLFQTVASRIRDGRWDDLPVLLLTLTPKSGTVDGTMKITNDNRASAIAVRLANVQLASIVTIQTLNIYRLNDVRRVEGPVKMPNYCGKVPIRMTEVYAHDVAPQSSWAYIIKRDVGEPDIDK